MNRLPTSTFVYDSKDIYDSRDLATDPRRVKTASHSAVETTRPSALQSLQVQLDKGDLTTSLVAQQCTQQELSSFYECVKSDLPALCPLSC